MRSRASFNAKLAQALADPATILLVSLANESRRGITCELVSPHGLSVSMNIDGDIIPCSIDVYQGLFSSSFLCKDHAMISIQVKDVQIDIGPVTSREQVAYTATSGHPIEAKVLEDADLCTIACQSYGDLFQVGFEAPRTALVQISES